MGYPEFLSKIVFCQWKIVGAVGKILQTTSDQVERLKPKLVTNGATYTFVIAVDDIQCHRIANIVKNSVENGELHKVHLYCNMNAICNIFFFFFSFHLCFVLILYLGF